VTDEVPASIEVILEELWRLAVDAARGNEAEARAYMQDVIYTLLEKYPELRASYHQAKAERSRKAMGWDT
jgi:hypothetical protein